MASKPAPQPNGYQTATLATTNNLLQVANRPDISRLSRLTLPEIQTSVDTVAAVAPAGNVPGLILHNLARLEGKPPGADTVHRDLQALWGGVERSLTRAALVTMFAGPAALILAYQKLLQLAGISPDSAFPNGVWQFYVEYALREDSARHANKTTGFSLALRKHQIALSDVDTATAWVMAAVDCLHQYPRMLENEYREKIGLAILAQLCGQSPSALLREWAQKRPYRRGADGGNQDYPAYRRMKFDAFVADKVDFERWAALLAEHNSDLVAYQEQISILATLQPEQYREKRCPLHIKDAKIAVVHDGRYYLLPACEPETDGRPLQCKTARSMMATVFAQPGGDSHSLIPLCAVQRRSLSQWLGANQDMSLALGELAKAPILVNTDTMRSDASVPLAFFRKQMERGIGSHPLTIAITEGAVVFDQSHIFFDGAWGAALAEILTGAALSWATYLHTLPNNHSAVRIAQAVPIPSYNCSDLPCIQAETAAESNGINLRAILALRRLLSRRNDLISLTVNDLLVLVRAIHAAVYKPSDTIVAALREIKNNGSPRQVEAAKQALDEISNRTNPGIVIPVDAALKPRDRLYPLTLTVPLDELRIASLHELAKLARAQYNDAPHGERGTFYQEFSAHQREYLGVLAQYGQIMSQAKEMANAGAGISMESAKLLGHLHPSLQKILDGMSTHVERVNNLIKGSDVFSNVGAVAPGSSLAGFITAKDDNRRKRLAWGVLTDAQGTMRVSLRDFRFPALIECGLGDIARQITEDYLASYVTLLNAFIGDLLQITQQSRETRAEQIG